MGNCHGQRYDNAINMFGTYKGLQARIKEIDTRWSAHSEVTKALSLNYANIQHSLQKIMEGDNQNVTTRNEAQALHKKKCRLKTAFVCN